MTGHPPGSQRIRHREDTWQGLEGGISGDVRGRR